jgi:predicted aldo/keto reductase-like oxidoreductase
MKRRHFLKTAGAVAGSYALGAHPAIAQETRLPEPQEAKDAPMPMRTLGRTGKKISVVAFPGLALSQYDQQRCTEGLHDALARGVNYFDVAPAYGRDGECEIKMGIGLQGIDRSKYVLSCKTKMRDKDGARAELERSLKRLKTDHFDLYQLHHLRFPEEVKRALGPGGAIETLLEAQKEGKVGHLGFSAHTTKGALEALNGFRFDTVMFPINFVEFFKIGFGAPVVELAKKQGAAVLGMKTLSMGAWPEGAERARKWWYRTTETQQEVSLALRYTLSQPAVVTGIPPSFLDLLDKAIIAAKSYRPLRDRQNERLRKVAESCLSVFEREEKLVAHGKPSDGPVYPDSPHECCPCAYA